MQFRPPTRFRIPILNAPLTRADYDDKPSYRRRQLSQYEGFKRLDKSLEKLETRASAREKVCDLCHRRCRAWRIIPHVDGKKLAGAAGMFGKVIVACDAGPNGCAAVLTRAGCVKQAIAEREAMKRLGLVVP